MFNEYTKIAENLAQKHDVQYIILKDDTVNGVMWYLEAEFSAHGLGILNDYGHCNAFTTNLEGKKPNVFEERSIKAINLVIKNRQD